MKSNQLILGTLLVAATLFDLHAFAAGNGSHGGRMWICDQDGKKTYELFDYRIGREELHLNYDFGTEPAEDSVELDSAAIELAQKWVKRLEKVEPEYAKLLLERVVGFMDRVEFTTDEYINLGDIDEVLRKPQNCDFKQVINQLPYDTKDSKKFKLTVQFWKLLNVFQRAGLIIHELAYEDVVANGNKKSDGIMRMNAYLASNEMDLITPDAWLEILKTNDLPFHTISHFVYNPKFQKIDDRGFLMVDLTESLDPLQNRIYFGDTAIKLLERQTLYLLNGVPVSVTHSSLQHKMRERLYWGLKVKTQNWSLEFDPLPLQINAEGKVLTAIVYEGCVNLAGASDSKNLCVEVAPGTRIFFHSNGSMMKFEPRKDFSVKYPSGDVVKFASGTIGLAVSQADFIHETVLLDSNQRVISGILSNTHKLRNTRGKKHRAYAFERVYLTQNGDLADSGIYDFSGQSKKFIRISEAGSEKQRLEICSIGDAAECEAIGDPSGYTREELEKLNLGMRSYFFGQRQAVSTKLSGINWVGPVFIWASNDNPTVPQILMLLPSGLGVWATAMVAVAEAPFGWVANKIFGRGRAKRHFLNDHYAVVEANIEELAKQMREQLPRH